MREHVCAWGCGCGCIWSCVYLMTFGFQQVESCWLLLNPSVLPAALNFVHNVSLAELMECIKLFPGCQRGL